jgi:hypothetical protein
LLKEGEKGEKNNKKHTKTKTKPAGFTLVSKHRLTPPQMRGYGKPFQSIE